MHDLWKETINLHNILIKLYIKYLMKLTIGTIFQILYDLSNLNPFIRK